MTTIGYDPILSESSARSYGIEPVSLEDLFKNSDFITIHTPLTKETKYILNTQSLAQCKKGARIVNCARGGIVDENALLQAIKSGHIAAAALDVLEEEPPTDASLELRMHPNVVVSPHLGASTVDAQERVARQIADNMSDILDGGAFIGVVNAPDLGAIKSKPHLVPYVMLAEKIGSMQAQLLRNNKINSITVNLRGKDVSDTSISDVIKSAVLKGALGELTSQSVTYINAMSLAEELGLKVLVNMSEKTEAGSGYMNSLSVDLEIEGFLNMSRSIEGTVFGRNELRITKFDAFSIDLPPGENILLFNNPDSPGILRKVSEKLASADVNIAHFSLGRQSQGKLAMGALVLDTPVPAEVLSTLGKYAGITNVMQIKMPNSADNNIRARSSGTLTPLNHSINTDTELTLAL